MMDQITADIFSGVSTIIFDDKSKLRDWTNIAKSLRQQNWSSSPSPSGRPSSCSGRLSPRRGTCPSCSASGRSSSSIGSASGQMRGWSDAGKGQGGQQEVAGGEQGRPEKSRQYPPQA